MRWLVSVSVLSLLLVNGCGSDEKQPDPPPAKAKTEPAKKAPEVAKAPEPAPDDEPIVIKGKHSTDASTVDNKPNQEKIDKLKAQAAASQGKDNGDAYREASASSTPKGRRKEIKDQIAAIDAQVKDLSAQRAKLMEKRKVREGKMMVEKDVATDPDAVAAIDKQIGDLQAQKQALQAEAADIEKNEPPPPPGSTPPSGADAPK
jgi:hypothetical protein